MRRFAGFIASLLILGMTPTVELLENVVHLAFEGHTAHALPDLEHEKEGAEHGCSGTFHICSCHTSPVFLEAAEAVLDTPVKAATTRVHFEADVPSEGHDRRLFRPPIS